MLSRVADSLYWMSRYLERAEHSARLVDVQLNMMLDQTPDVAQQRWRRVVQCLGAPMPDLIEESSTADALTRSLTVDLANPSSIVSCIIQARENARQVREQISSEMWEQLNRLFHEVKRVGLEEIHDGQPLEFLQSVKEGSHLFQGITDSTMSHGQGWQFIQVGRSLERAIATSRLLDVSFLEFLHEDSDEDDPAHHLEWVGLLKSCTAFEAYCKVYTAGVRPTRVAEYLLLDPDFPHSVRFSVDQLQHALTDIANSTPRRETESVARLAGRLHGQLAYSSIEDVRLEGLQPFLENIQSRCDQIHSAIHEVYITYPVQLALQA